MVPARSHKVSRVSWYSGYRRCLLFSCTGLSPSLAGFPNTILLGSASSLRSETPERTRSGLASFAFARRYLRNRSFFLFLALLRCFSSGGSPPHAMDSRTDAWSLSMRVSPFRHPRIIGYLHLPAAFRSLSRLSSALSAKASSLCSFMLDLATSAAVSLSDMPWKLASLRLDDRNNCATALHEIECEAFYE